MRHGSVFRERLINTAALQSVLVTGGSGFIGARLVRSVIERGGRVHCLARGRQRVDAIRSLGAHVTLGDVTNRDNVSRSLAESQAAVVFHLAGLVRARCRDEFTHVNCGGVESVASACAARPDPPALVVASSLAAVGPHPADQVRTETDIPSPISHYGRSKLAGERAASKYAGVVPITIVRPPVVFGPGDRAMLEVFRPIARWGVHVVPGRHGGGRRVSLVHVDDLVEGLLLAAANGERVHERGAPGQGVYFMAGEDRPTYADLGRSIAEALGRKPPAIIRMPGPALRLLGICGDLIGRARRRPGWINSDKMTEALATGSWSCSAAKAREQLGWSAAPQGALADRLRATAEWYRRAGWI